MLSSFIANYGNRPAPDARPSPLEATDEPLLATPRHHRPHSRLLERRTRRPLERPRVEIVYNAARHDIMLIRGTADDDVDNQDLERPASVVAPRLAAS